MKFSCRPVRVVGLAALLALGACNSQDDSIPTPVIRPSSVAPAGIYTGTWTSTANGTTTAVTALIDSDDRFMLYNADGSFIASGTYLRAEASRGLSVQARAYTLTEVVPDEDEEEEEAETPTPEEPVFETVITTFAAQGTYDEDDRILMTYVSTGNQDEGSLDLRYQKSRYESRSDLILLNGDWGLKDPFGVPTTTIYIDQGGSLSGQDEVGCLYSGTFSLIDQHYNLYRTQLRSQCPNSNGAPITASTTGLATLVKSTAAVDGPSELVSISVSSKAAVLLRLDPL